MHIRVLDSSMIVDFINKGFDSNEVCSLIKSEAEKIAQVFNVEKLNDWEVCFRFIYTNVSQILIYTKEKSNKDEKYKEITAHIPIPTKDKIPWGVNLDQHVYGNEKHLDHLINNFDCLDSRYTKYNDRKNYILDSMRRVIKFSFEKGFVINGVKVKIRV